MAMNLLILGAAGFLGSHFTWFLINHAERQWNITVNLYPMRVLPQELIELSESRRRINLEAKWVNIRDYHELRSITTDMNFCINFARFSWSLKDHRKAGQAYENMVDTIFQACLANGVQKTIHVSCALVFGPRTKNRREPITKIPRTLGSRPRSVPRFIKSLEREFYHVQQYVSERTFPMNVIYFPILMGLGETHIMGDLMLDFLLNDKPILERLVLEKNKGHHRLNVLPVMEAVRACRQLLLDPRIGCQHVVAGVDVTLQELLTAWKEAGISRTQIPYKSFCNGLASQENHWLNKFMVFRRFKARQGKLTIKRNKELEQLLSHDWSFSSINYTRSDNNKLTPEKVIEESVNILSMYQQELLKVAGNE